MQAVFLILIVSTPFFTSSARAAGHGGGDARSTQNPPVVVVAEPDDVEPEARREARQKVLKIFQQDRLTSLTNGTWAHVSSDTVDALKNAIAEFLTADGEKLEGTMKLRPEQTPFAKTRWVVSSETREDGVATVRQKYWLVVDEKNGTVTKEVVPSSLAFAHTKADASNFERGKNHEKIWNTLGANRLEAAKNWEDDSRWETVDTEGKKQFTAAYRLLKEAVKAEAGLDVDFRIKVVTIPGEKHIVIRCVNGETILKELKIEPRTGRGVR